MSQHDIKEQLPNSKGLTQKSTMEIWGAIKSMDMQIGRFKILYENQKEENLKLKAKIKELERKLKTVKKA